MSGRTVNHRPAVDTHRNGLAGAMLLAMPLAAEAVIVEYTIEGTISQFVNGTSAFGSALSTGDPVTAILKYDTESVAEILGTSIYVFDAPTASPPTKDASAFFLDVDIKGQFRGAGAGGTIAIGNATFDVFTVTSSANRGFSGDSINGLFWRQTDMVLRDRDGTLYNSVNLPDSIAELNNFEETFFQVQFTDVPNSTSNFYYFNVQIDTISAALSTALVQTDLDVNAQDVVVLPPSPEHDDSGSVGVTLPDSLNLAQGQTTVAFKAQYTQQPVSELDLTGFNFVIPGDNFQLWELSMDNALIPAGELVELVFQYDDTGMSLFDELTLDVLHFVGGTWVPLGGTVDTVNNTIRAFTPSFSPFTVASVGQVPTPVVAWLMLAGLGAYGAQSLGRRRPA